MLLLEATYASALTPQAEASPTNGKIHDNVVVHALASLHEQRGSTSSTEALPVFVFDQYSTVAIVVDRGI